MPEKNQLQQLDARKTKINDDTLAHLAKATQLEKAWLSETSITNAGLAHLSGLDKLVVLDIAHTKVDGASGRIIGGRLKPTRFDMKAFIGRKARITTADMMT